MAKESQSAGHIEAALKSAEYHFSEELGLSISTDFLRVDDRVVAAADQLGIPLDWDDVGRIRDISFVDARRLFDSLGGHLLTPTEYWLLYFTAKRAGRSDILASLTSDEATEWLDAVYIRSGDRVLMAEHPDLSVIDGQVHVSGDFREVYQPIGRPGWFNPDTAQVDPDTGIPAEVSTTRAKGTPSWSESTWKYWSTYQENEPRGEVRGFVISSGTPSKDCDIPILAKMKHLMVRECRSTLPEPELDQAIVDAVLPLISLYLETICEQPGLDNVREHELLYQSRHLLFEFLKQYGDSLVSANNHGGRIIREKITDILGIVRLEAIRRRDDFASTRAKEFSNKIYPEAIKSVSLSELKSFVSSSAARLEYAISHHQPIVFVIGHRNPDTDTVISSLFEAYRQSLLYRNVCHVPVIQADRVPDEIARLLGEDLSNSFILWNHPLFRQAESLGQTRWILTDHNKSPHQRFAISIVDHHIMSKIAQGQNIVKTWDMAGSCSAQIGQKLSGMGIDLDQGLARLLHGATLMDTENRGPKKMTYRDRLIMDYLHHLSGVSDETGFYQDLMSYLLNTNDPQRLLDRDYKEDWGIFGFAVAKVKGMFGQGGQDLKPAVLTGLKSAAEANNQAKNLCMTIVKVVDYQDNNESVNCERIYLVFNQYAPAVFREVMFDVLAHIIRHQFGQQTPLRITSEYIEFKSAGDQLSRKVTAPEFEDVVAAFNRFYHSQTLGKDVARDFLKLTPEVKHAANELNIELHTDKQGRICNITYYEMKKLAARLGYTMLSMAEFWRLLAETDQTHDAQMRESLISCGFVEVFDTIVSKGHEMIDHPQVIETDSGPSFTGEVREVNVIPAHPGLIWPKDIDPSTGLPLRVSFDQSGYADPDSLRYWSPDAVIVNPARSFIFLSDKPALDMKNHPDDALPNMGARFVCENPRYPHVSYVEKDGKLEIIISE